MVLIAHKSTNMWCFVLGMKFGAMYLGVASAMSAARRLRGAAAERQQCYAHSRST